MALMASRLALAQTLEKIRERRGKRFGYVCSEHVRWQTEISMHYTPDYTFNDAEL